MKAIQKLVMAMVFVASYGLFAQVDNGIVYLINSNTNARVLQLNSGNNPIDINKYGTALNIEAAPFSSYAKVNFIVPGLRTWAEQNAPYAFFGDNAGNFNSWVDPVPQEGQSYNMTIQYLDGSGAVVDTDTLTINFVNGSSTSGNYVKRINCGPSIDAVYQGKVFEAGPGASGVTTTGDLTNNNLEHSGETEPLKSIRYTKNPSMAYSFTGLQDGRYDVTLHFSEVYHGVAPGSSQSTRRFNIDVEGQLIRPNYNIFEASGGSHKHSLQQEVTVNDGSLDMVFGKVDNDPIINAIEVVWVGTITQNTAPTITSFTESGKTQSSISLSWAATDDQGVSFYLLKRNGDEIYEGPLTTNTNNGLAADTEYVYSLLAYDYDSNISAESTITVRTEGDGGGTGGNTGSSIWSQNGSNVYYNSGNVGIGTNNPTVPLDIISDLAGQENFIKLSSKDASEDYFKIFNATNQVNQLISRLEGHHASDNRVSLQLSGTTNGSNDNGNHALLNFDARLNNSPVQNRPLFVWTNYNQEKMTMLANGNVGIGTVSPTEMLHVAKGARIYKSSFGSTQGTANNGWLRETWLTGNYGPPKWDEEAALWKRPTGNYNDVGGIVWDNIGTYLLRIPKGDKHEFTREEFMASSFFFADWEGNIGIGTTTPDAKLAVNGRIHTQEVKVDLDNWPDYVFEEGYDLPTLEEVKKHIEEKGHLPNIPSASEVEDKGALLGAMNAKLLEKIEELTLYILQLEEDKKEQQVQLKELASQIKEIKEYLQK